MGGSNHDVNITINTLSKTVGTKDAKASMRLLGDEFKRATGLSLGYAGALTATIAVGKRLIDFTAAAIQKNEAYTSSVVDSARATGNSVEQMSRLIQASDDFFVKQDELNTALSFGAKKGLDVTVAGIKSMADEYNNLATPQEKASYLNEKFGKSGLVMGKLLEQGSGGITKAMESVSKYLVVTEKTVKMNYEYKKSQDAVSDATEAFTYSVAQGAMPAVTDMNIGWAAYLETLNESEVVTKILTAGLWMLEGAIQGLDVVFGGYTTDMEHEIELAKQAAEAQMAHRGTLVGMGVAAKDAGDALEEMAVKAAFSGNIQSATKEYLETIGQLTEEQSKNTSNLEYWQGVINRAPAMVSELTAKMKEFAEEGDVNSEEYKKMQEQLEKWQTTVQSGPGTLATLTKAVEGNTTAQSDAYNKILLATQALMNQTLIAGLDEKAQLEVGRALGIVSEADYAAVISSQALREEYDQGKLSAEEMGNKAKYLADMIARMQSKDITITTFHVDVYKKVLEGQVWNGVMGTGAGVMGEKASGGWAGGLTLVGEQGPEILRLPPSSYVYNNSQTQQMLGGNQVTNYITISGAGDARAVAREVMHEIKLQMGGH